MSFHRIACCRGRWRPFNDGLPNTVTALSAYADVLYAGWNFLLADPTVKRIRRFEAGAWADVAWPTDAGNFFQFAEFGGKLYVFGGIQGSYNGSTWGTDTALANHRGGATYGSDLAVYPTFSGFTVGLWDGSTKTSLGTVSGTPFAAVEYDGDLILAGTISDIDGTSVSNVGRYDGSWHAMGAGINGDVYALAVYAGNLYAGGDFTTAGGNAAISIAKWDGSTWSAVDGGMTGTAPVVRAMLTWNGSLVVGGSFDGAGSVSTPNLVRLIGSTFTDFGTGTDGDVLAMAKHNGGRIAVGGDFTTIDGVSANRVAWWTRPETA
jgi:hypothetical protein